MVKIQTHDDGRSRADNVMCLKYIVLGDTLFDPKSHPAFSSSLLVVRRPSAIVSAILILYEDARRPGDAD